MSHAGGYTSIYMASVIIISLPMESVEDGMHVYAYIQSIYLFITKARNSIAHNKLHRYIHIQDN